MIFLSLQLCVEGCRMAKATLIMEDFGPTSPALYPTCHAGPVPELSSQAATLGLEVCLPPGHCATVWWGGTFTLANACTPYPHKLASLIG